jgi:STE24 endopeptidase
VSRGLAARAALAATLAVVWTAAIWLLWTSTTVPSLHLPHLDPAAYFSAQQLRAAASYSRFERILWLLSTIAKLGALVVFARYGVRWAKESAAGRMGTGMLLGMLGFALVWAVQVPFSVLELWWERRHQLSSLGYVSVILGNWLALGGQFVFLCLALAIVMGFARAVGDWWWLLAAPAFIGLALLFAFISPWLGNTHPLRQPALRAAAVRLERIEHVRHTPIEIEAVHDTTSLPNAEATGLGSSRRVILWDTLVDGRFSDREVTVVIAHELGHLAHNHIWKSLGWYALFAFPGTFLIAQATRRRGGMSRPEAVPLSLLVLVGLTVLGQPVQNVVTRHMEAEADWSSLQATHDPAGATGLFKRFVPTTLSQPSPPTWDYVMLENHPTIMQRIAMVQAWRSRRLQP